jgi:hypothetical protein
MVERLVCDVETGWVRNDDDCDDTTSLVSPAADELCNGIDDNCSGVVDEGFVGTAFNLDADGYGYGYGNPFSTDNFCMAPEGWVANGDDCDDMRDFVFPGATELCNGLDDDCDNDADDGLVPLRSYYLDGDQDGFGNPGYSDSLCTAPENWTTDQSDCDDTDPLISPDAVEDCDTPDDDDCNPDTTCGPSGDLRAADHHVFLPVDSGERAGAAVAIARDGAVTRIAIGAPSYATEATERDGAVYLMTAPTTPATTSLSAGEFLTSARWGFGYAISATHDMDGDGAEDLLVSAPFTSNSTGRVYVVSSRATSADSPAESSAILRITANNNWVYSGYSLASGHDLTGDGTPDLVVGAPLTVIGPNTRGRVAVISGAARGSVTINSNVSNIRGTNNSQTGVAVAILPDFNGDGVADLAVGSNLVDISGVDNGQVAVYFGPLETGNLDLDEADVTYWGESAGDIAGTAVANAGDVNGDGLSDLIIGAPGHSQDGILGRGAAYIVYGSSAPSSHSLGSADATFLGHSPAMGLGRAVSSAGDVDGNGLDDVLVGQPEAVDHRGGAFLQLAPYMGTVNVGSDAFLLAAHDNHEVGFALAPAGDVNGDGLDDFLIGNPGADTSFVTAGSVILSFGLP